MLTGFRATAGCHLSRVGCVLALLVGAACGPTGEDGNGNANNNNQAVVDQDGDGYSVAQGDCDDEDAAVHPGAAEVPDGKDNDCDGFLDDDNDHDGYGVANASRLGVLDPTTWQITDRGAMSSQAEVTGTGDGELWAILPLEARMVRLNKSNAAELESHPLPGFPAPVDIDTFAFAHWGGSLWVFVREYGMGRSTDIYQFDEAFNFTRVAQDIGFVIVGAGVSTCAPVTVL